MSVFRNKNLLKGIIAYVMIIFIIVCVQFYVLVNSYSFILYVNSFILLWVVLILVKKLRMTFEKIEFLEDQVIFHSIVNTKSLKLGYNQLEFTELKNKSFINIVGIGEDKLICLKLKDWIEYDKLVGMFKANVKNEFDHKSHERNSLVLFFVGLFSW